MTLRELLDQAVAKSSSRIAVKFKRAGEWQTLSYAELHRVVSQMAEAFGDLGVVPGEDKVALMLDNGPEWIESYFALAGCGVVVVPIDPQLRPAEIAYILKDSDSAMLLAQNRHLSVLDEISKDLPSLRFAVIADDLQESSVGTSNLPLYGYADLKKRMSERDDLSWFSDNQPESGQVASIIYTSGTMGQPKGAMLTHNNFCSDVSGSLAAIDYALSGRDDFLVVLPLFHSFSFTANLLLAIANASGILFVENLRTIAQDIKVLRPTILMAVPLLCEKLFFKINSRLQSNAITRCMLKLRLGWLLGRQVRKGLGGRLRHIIVGGAPCPVDIIKSFQRLGISVVEGYGLTECSPVVAFPKLNESRIGTIGRKLPNVEVRIANPNEKGAGELQVRGPMVMKGYYKDLAATRAAFDGEWLKTGDIATIDTQGYIRICGREKALIVNREGKNIYPEEVENAIALDPLLYDVVVVGYRVGDDPGERVGVIIVPDPDLMAEQFSGDAEDPAAVESFVKERLSQQCAGLAPYKHPRKLVISTEPLQRTSVQKVRRCVYQGKLDG